MAVMAVVNGSEVDRVLPSTTEASASIAPTVFSALATMNIAPTVIGPCRWRR